MGSSLCNLFVDPELILPAKFHLWFDIANFSVDCRGEWHLCITLLAVCYKCTNRLKLQLTSLETAERLWRQIMYPMNNIIGKSTKFNGRHFLIFIKTKFMLYIYIYHAYCTTEPQNKSYLENCRGSYRMKGKPYMHHFIQKWLTVSIFKISRNMHISDRYATTLKNNAPKMNKSDIFSPVTRP